MAVELIGSPAYAPTRIPEILPSLVQNLAPQRRLPLKYCPENMPVRVGLTRAQRRWLRARATDEDGILRSEWTGRPIQFPSIHHIHGIAWMISRYDPLNLDGPDLYNDPYNLIVLSESEHRRLHPENELLINLRKYNRRRFHQESRRLKWRIMDGEKNWDDQYDSDFLDIVEFKTIELIQRQHPWPTHDVQYTHYKASIKQRQRLIALP